MEFRCSITGCKDKFKTNAQLNFHLKKVHKQSSLIESSSGQDKQYPFRMVKFGKHPGTGAYDLRKRPMLISQSAIKLFQPTLHEKLYDEKGNRRKTNPSPDATDEVFKLKPVPVPVVMAPPPKLIKNTKVGSTFDIEIEVDKDMPVLTPQVRPVRIQQNSVPTPKISHNQNELEDVIIKEVDEVVINRKKPRFEDLRNVNKSKDHSQSDLESNYSTSASLRSVHSTNKLIIPLECPVQTCKKTFNSRSFYHNHLEIHEGLKPYVCPHCSFGYATDISLLEHMSRKHSNDPAFKCDKCGVMYKVSRYFQKHKCAKSPT